MRGDSHYARPEAMDWLDDNAIAYAFGLAGNAALKARVAALAEDAAVRHALAGDRAKVRRYAAFAYAARSWRQERRVIARIEASDRGADVRFVVTNLADKPKRLYEPSTAGAARWRT